MSQGQQHANIKQETFKKLAEKHGYTSQGQLSMFWVAQYITAQWCYKLYAECVGKSDTA